MGSYPKSQMGILSCAFAISRDKIKLSSYFEGLQTINWNNALITWSWKVTDKRKPLYLLYQSVYGHQRWQDDNLSWLMVPAYKVTWPFDYLWLQSHVANWKHFIANTTAAMAAKSGRMVASFTKKLVRFYRELAVSY